MIVTFYSFKGGVGRSMAMANVAELLAQRGRTVIACDWDLEAPGLERYLIEDTDERTHVLEQTGLIDLVDDYRGVISGRSQRDEATQDDRSFRQLGKLRLRRPSSCVRWLERDHQGKIGVLTAGRRAGAATLSDYATRVQSINWTDFYEKWAGSQYVEFLRQDLDEAADFVLVDSRTGITEHGGVCTHHLADLVVLLSMSNDQGLAGIDWLASDLVSEELHELRNGRSLTVLPIPARIDKLSQKDELVDFRKEFRNRFTKYLHPELGPAKDFFFNSEIPYEPWYSFYERVAAREDPDERKEELYLAYRNLTDSIEELGRGLGFIFEDWRDSASAIEKGDRARLDGNTPKARRHFDHALSIRSRVAQETGETDHWLGVAEVHFRLGDIAREEGLEVDAERHYSQAVLLTRTAARQSTAMTAREGLATSLLRSANAMSDLGKRDEALAATREAAELYRSLSADQPETFLPALAAALNSLSAKLSDMGHRKEALNVIEEAVAIQRSFAETRSGALSDLAVSLASLSYRLFDLGEYAKAIASYEEVLEIARQTGDLNAESAALGNLGNSYYRLGEYARAVVFYEQVLEISSQTRNRNTEGATLGNLGSCYYRLGEYAKAIEYHELALEIARQTGNRNSESSHLGNLGICYSSLGAYARAIDHHEQALEIARQIGNRDGASYDLGNLGVCYASLGDYAKAIDFHEQALEISRQIGNRDSESSDLGNLGSCYQRLGDYVNAIEYLGQALDIARQTGNRDSESTHLGNLGICYSSLGGFGTAIDHHNEALEIARQTGNRDSESHDLGHLGVCYSSLGDCVRAVNYLEQALEIARQTGNRYLEATQLTYLARTQQAQQQLKAARSSCETALAISDQTGEVEPQAEARTELARTLLAEGNPPRALKVATEAQSIHYPTARANAHLLAATALVLLDRPDEAGGVFEQVLEHTRHQLAVSETFGAFDTQALAFCGLTLTRDDRTAEATASFERARAITNATGVVQRTLATLDQLASVDRSNNGLRTLRAAAQGSTTASSS